MEDSDSRLNSNQRSSAISPSPELSLQVVGSSSQSLHDGASFVDFLGNASQQQSLETIPSSTSGTDAILETELEPEHSGAQAKDPFLKAFNDIRAKVYAKQLTAQEKDKSYFADTSTVVSTGQVIRKVSSKPDNDLDELAAYIQGQLKGKDGPDARDRSHLVPVPLRYRRQLRSRSRDGPNSAPRKSISGQPPVLFDYDFPDENPERDRKLVNEFMGCGTHAPPSTTLNEIYQRNSTKARSTVGTEKLASGNQFQRIFPEDPTWKLTIVERLSEICLQTIQINFQDMPYQLAALPVELQQRFIPELPIASEVNLYLAADYFHNESYWERSCKARWGKNTFPHIHGSWKLTYIERGFQDSIENYIPLQSDPNILLNDLLNIGEYILYLKIGQLLPPVRHTFGDFAAMMDAQLTNHIHFTEPYEEIGNNSPDLNNRRHSTLRQVPMPDEVKHYLGPKAENQNEFPSVKTPRWTDKAKIKFERLVNRDLNLNKSINEDQVLMDITTDLDDTPAHPRTMNPFMAADHMNLVPVVANMPHLLDLELRYGVRECGMNFSWRLFQFTLNDAKRLVECLVICPSLRRLCLRNCNIDDPKGAIVCYALLDHPNLAILELQCNRLGDETADVIGRMIRRSEVLKKIDLSENAVGVDGAKSIARSLVRGTSLRILNLHMNQIADLGAEALLLVLKSCITFLQQIVISGNNITGAIIDLLTGSMKNNRRLEKYDLSVNELEGVIVSQKIQDTLAQSHHIQQFNIQQNRFSSEYEACIQDILFRNQDARLEQVLTEMEHTFNFNIATVKLPTENWLRRSSEELLDSSDTEDENDGSSRSSRIGKPHAESSKDGSRT